MLPAASRATAVSVCDSVGALPVVFQLTEYGALVSSAPRFAPSSLNCTPTTPTLSEAFAAIATDPDTVAPAAGVVSPTVGSVVSPGGGGGDVVFDTVTVRCEVAVLPAASRANAVMVCDPLGTLPDGQLIEYGALVSSAPMLAPSTLNCTPTTPTLSDASAAALTDPETVAPAAGLVSATDGAAVSAGGGGGVVALETSTRCSRTEDFPVASTAVTLRTCVPFEALVVSHLVLVGDGRVRQVECDIVDGECHRRDGLLELRATVTTPETVVPSAGRTFGHTFLGELPLHCASG